MGNMSEAEKDLREWVMMMAEHTPNIRAAGLGLVDAALSATRDAALEEAAQHHDRKGDGARAWLDEHEQRGKANVVASWRTSLEVHRRAAVAIRALKSRPAERFFSESEVREVCVSSLYGDVGTPSAELTPDERAHNAGTREVASRLGVDLDAPPTLSGRVAASKAKMDDGPRCRDCADNAGTCPYTNRPCNE